MSQGRNDRGAGVARAPGLLRRLRASLDARVLRRTVRMLEASVRRDGWATRPLLRPLGIGPKTRFHRLFAMPLEWLDATRGATATTLLEPAGEGSTHGPRIAGRQPVERVRPPEIRRHEFRDARVCAMSSSVLLADRVVVERAPPHVDVSR